MGGCGEPSCFCSSRKSSAKFVNAAMCQLSERADFGKEVTRSFNIIRVLVHLPLWCNIPYSACDAELKARDAEFFGISKSISIKENLSGDKNLTPCCIHIKKKKIRKIRKWYIPACVGCSQTHKDLQKAQSLHTWQFDNTQTD